MCKAERLIKLKQYHFYHKRKNHRKIIYIDIDNTICLTPENLDYSKAKPIEENIIKANKLYDEGNIIVYWTARGTVTGISWRQITEKQFKDWNVKFHEIKFGKPNFDLLIDDRAINTKDW